MKDSYKYIFVTFALGALLAPQIALAAWWNPFTWDFSSWFKKPQVQEQSIASSSTTTSKTSITPAQMATSNKTNGVAVSTKTTIPTTPPSPAYTAPKTYTLPSGAVIDANGNVITPAPQTQEPVQPTQQTPAPQTALCNGVRYTKCTNGGAFICPSDGSTAYCTSPQTTAAPSSNVTSSSASAATNESTTGAEQAVLNSIDNQISPLQTQVNACLGQMTSNISFQTGVAQVAQQTQAAKCQNYSSELNDFLVEKSFILKGGYVSSTCSNQIRILEGQILSLRQTAVEAEAGALTSGADLAFEQGSVRNITQTEAAQEAPLVQQVAQNLYYCQN